METFSIKGKALVFEVRWTGMFTSVLLTMTPPPKKRWKSNEYLSVGKWLTFALSRLKWRELEELPAKGIQDTEKYA